MNESGNDLLLAAVTGDIGALVTFGVAGTDKFEGGSASQVLSAGRESDRLIATRLGQGIFQTGNREFPIGEAGNHLDINAAHPINGFLKEGKVDDRGVVNRQTQGFQDGALGEQNTTAIRFPELAVMINGVDLRLQGANPKVAGNGNEGGLLVGIGIGKDKQGIGQIG